MVGVRFNALYLVYVALEATSLFALLGLLLHLNPAAIRERVGDRAPVQMIGGFLIGIALLFATMWVADAIRRAPRSSSAPRVILEGIGHDRP